MRQSFVRVQKIAAHTSDLTPTDVGSKAADALSLSERQILHLSRRLSTVRSPATPCPPHQPTRIASVHAPLSRRPASAFVPRSPLMSAAATDDSRRVAHCLASLIWPGQDGGEEATSLQRGWRPCSTSQATGDLKRREVFQGSGIGS